MGREGDRGREGGCGVASHVERHLRTSMQPTIVKVLLEEEIREALWERIKSL